MINPPPLGLRSNLEDVQDKEINYCLRSIIAFDHIEIDIAMSSPPVIKSTQLDLVSKNVFY